MKTWILAFAIVAGWATVAAAKPVDISHPIGTGGAVRVDVSYGRVRVVGSKSGQVRVRQVRVTGTIDDQLRGVSVDRAAGAVEVRVRLPLLSRLLSRWSDQPPFRVELLVEVPSDVRLFVVSRDATVDIEGIEGPVGVGVVTSEVSVRGRPSTLSVTTVSGSLDFDGTTSSLEASTMSGRLATRGATKRIELDTVTGSIDFVGTQIQAATLSTVSGDIRVAGRFGSDSRVEIETESGDVSLEVCDPANVEVDLATRDSEIVNDLDDVPPIRDGRGWRRLQHVVGSGGGTAGVQTRSGLIWLTAAGVGDEGASTSCKDGDSGHA